MLDDFKVGGEHEMEPQMPPFQQHQIHAFEVKKYIIIFLHIFLGPIISLNKTLFLSWDRAEPLNPCIIRSVVFF